MTYPVKNPCTCDDCGGPLPEGSRKTRVRCDNCRKIHILELDQENRIKRQYRIAQGFKPTFKRTRNLMKRLGMDYVELRLKRP